MKRPVRVTQAKVRLTRLTYPDPTLVFEGEVGLYRDRTLVAVEDHRWAEYDTRWDTERPGVLVVEDYMLEILEEDG